jgi:hypothetical protein
LKNLEEVEVILKKWIGNEDESELKRICSLKYFYNIWAWNKVEMVRIPDAILPLSLFDFDSNCFD